MNSGRQAFELYQTLDHQQKRFLQEKDMEGTKTLENWISFLEGPVAYDVLIDKTTRTLKLAIRLLWIFAIFNIVIAFVTQSGYLGVVGLGMASLAVYQRMKRGSYFKRDLHNHLRLFFYPALEGMMDFLDKDTLITSQFQLREKDRAEFIIIFSFDHAGKTVEVKVPSDHYQINLEGTQISGQNLSHVDFCEDLKSIWN